MQNDRAKLQQDDKNKKRFSISRCFIDFFYWFFILMLKILVYYGDIITDIFLVIKFWDQGKHYFGVLVSFIIICHLYKVYEIFHNEHRLYGLKALLEFIGIGQLLRYLFPTLFTVNDKQIFIYQGIMQSAPSFMICILSIFYENKPIHWDISNNVYQQAQTISFCFSMASLFYSNYSYFYVRYEDFKNAHIKMKALFALFNFGEYSARVCSWALAAYFGGKIFVWTIIGIDIVFAIIASCAKLSDNRLIPFYDYVFCYRMYDCYLFYGNQFDSRNYVNLKEFERFVVQLAVIAYVIQEVSESTEYQVFFYAMLYVCVVGFIINFVYNANRLLFKKDDESEIIRTYKRMIENLENEKNELNLKIKHIVPQVQKEEENKQTIAKIDEENSQLNTNMNQQLESLQQQIAQLEEKVKSEELAKNEFERFNSKLEEAKLKLEEDLKLFHDRINKLEKALLSEQKESENLRGDKAIIQQHLATERKQNDELKRVNYYLQHEQAIPPFYGEDLQKQLESIKKQNREAEERWKALEQMYQKRERELKEQIYKQANHDIEINSQQSVSNVLKKQNEVMNKKFKEKEAEVVLCQYEIKQLQQEMKQLKEINQKLNDKLEFEERLTNQQEVEMKLLKNFNPEEYSQNQHTNLSLLFLVTGSVAIQKFEDHKNLSRETERVVFNNFISMNLIEKLNQTVKYPYFFQFNFSKKSSLFNTSQNSQNELFIFSTLATKNYPQVIKALSILAANWINVTSESFQCIQKIIQNCTSLKVLELNYEKLFNKFIFLLLQIVGKQYQKKLKSKDLQRILNNCNHVSIQSFSILIYLGRINKV